MRITNGMMISNMIRNLGNNQERLSKYQNQLDTGKKISVPSDDPVVAARALKLRTDVAKVEQYQKNINDAQSWLESSDVALGKIGDVLNRARELTVQASNGTNTPEETQKIALELNQLKVQAIHLSNSSYAGRYIFSGYKTDQKLINDDETNPNFGRFSIDVNNTDKIFYEIGVGDSININIAGGDLFHLGGDADNPTNGVSTSTVDEITFPYTIDATNNTIDVSINGANINVSLPLSSYADYASLSSAVETAVNAQIDIVNAGLPMGSTPVPHITASMQSDKIELRTISKTANSEINITLPASSFFSGINIANTVETKGDIGEKPSMIKMFDDVIAYMNSGKFMKISEQIDKFDTQISNVLRCRADIGARQNRVDLSDDRMSNDLINYTKLMSENEDVDIAETIMNLKNEENVYQASLAGGARIIQQTLVDFLR